MRGHVLCLGPTLVVLITVISSLCATHPVVERRKCGRIEEPILTVTSALMKRSQEILEQTKVGCIVRPLSHA